METQLESMVIPSSCRQLTSGKTSKATIDAEMAAWSRAFAGMPTGYQTSARTPFHAKCGRTRFPLRNTH